jgi:hypothetical protein
MAQFSVEIADADVSRVLNALAANYRRPEQIPNPEFDPMQSVSEVNLETIDNPETIAQFANRVVRNFLTENVRAYEVRLAKQQAEDALNTNITINDPAL